MIHQTFDAVEAAPKGAPKGWALDLHPHHRACHSEDNLHHHHPPPFKYHHHH